MASQNHITVDELKAILRYDPETGEFWWRVSRKGIRLGRPAGRVTGRYRQIGIDGRHYYAHRLAWLYMTGEWPSDDIDHIDGDRLNNRFSNLREASRAQNMANGRTPATNTSGFKGVSFDRQRGRWQAFIKIDGKTKNLGRFKTPEDAHAAYVAAAHQKSGNFARTE